MVKTKIQIVDNMGGDLPSGVPQPIVKGAPVVPPNVFQVVATDEPPPPAPKKDKGE